MTILAGYRNTDGDFNNKGNEENFWSCSPASNKDKAHYCYLNRGNNTPKFNTNSREFGFGVLLFKDKNTILLGNQLMLQITDLFQAYYDCRKNKRKSHSAIEFELNYESNLITLYNEIIERKYKIGKSTVFIVKDPVKREVFAADFRDRIVHHLIINKINPILEKMFIFDSYSCRVGKGTSFGIKRIKKFIRSCSDNYKKDCYILKLDIEGFFMNINKDILKKKCLELFESNPNLINVNWLIYLVNEVIMQKFMNI